MNVGNLSAGRNFVKRKFGVCAGGCVTCGVDTVGFFNENKFDALGDAR